jgi:hypothetical protein
MSTRLTCRPCGRSYRVPHTDRVWNCKQCGEPLDAAPQDDHADTADPAPDDAQRKEELKRVNAELKRWRKTLKGIKAYCIVAPSIAIGVYVVTIGLVMLSHGQQLYALLVLASLVVLALLTRFVYRAVDARPVFAMKVLAVGITVWFLASFLELAYDPLGGFIGPLISIWCVIATWASIPRAKRGQELMEKYPDAYRRRDASERPQVQGQSLREQHRESAKRQSKSDSRLAAWMLAGAAALAAIGGVGYWYSLQPPDPAPTLQAFRESWEGGDLDAIAEHANSPKIDRGLRRYWKKRDWVADPPDLAGWTQERKSKERLKVQYELANGLVSDTRWMWSEGRWRLIAFGYPQ